MTPAECKPFYRKTNHLKPEKPLIHCVSGRVQGRGTTRLLDLCVVYLYLHMVTWVHLLDAALMDIFSLNVDPSDCPGAWFPRGRHAY